MDLSNKWDTKLDGRKTNWVQRPKTNWVHAASKLDPELDPELSPELGPQLCPELGTELDPKKKAHEYNSRGMADHANVNSTWLARMC